MPARNATRGAGQPFRDAISMKRRINRRDAIADAGCGWRCLGAERAARASGFPNRPIRIVVPVAPGGGVDTFARLIAAKVKTQRDVQFIVENRTGGNSTIGGLDVQRAAPDGYTVLFHASTHNVARLVLKNAPYDPVADFTPIALAGERAAGAHRRQQPAGKNAGRDRRRGQGQSRQVVVRDRPARRARPSRRCRVQSVQRPQRADHSPIAARRRPPTTSSAATCR